MKDVYNFLLLLSNNNNKEWFNAHKSEYLDIQAQFNSFTEKLIYEISLWDKDINPDSLSVKDCTYRIYRDTRFSKNKLPYKTHIGAFVCKGGKKSPYSGYYFHIEPKEVSNCTWLHSSLLATGMYCPEPKIVRSIRDEIYVNGDSFLNAIAKAKGFAIDNSSSLKKLPKGFEDVNQKWQELIKLKDFSVYKNVEKDFIFDNNLLEKLSLEFKKTYEFNKLLNMAVDYAINEM